MLGWDRFMYFDVIDYFIICVFFPGHTLINVECRAWAKNIFYKRSLQNREGSVHFELMID